MNTTQKWALFIGLVLIAFVLVCGYAYPKQADADEHNTCEWTRDLADTEIAKLDDRKKQDQIILDYLYGVHSAPCPVITEPEATPTPTPTPTPEAIYYGTPTAGQACPDWDDANQVHRNDDGTYKCSHAH